MMCAGSFQQVSAQTVFSLQGVCCHDNCDTSIHLPQQNSQLGHDELICQCARYCAIYHTLVCTLCTPVSCSDKHITNSAWNKYIMNLFLSLIHI